MAGARCSVRLWKAQNSCDLSVLCDQRQWWCLDRFPDSWLDMSQQGCQSAGVSMSASLVAFAWLHTCGCYNPITKLHPHWQVKATQMVPHLLVTCCGDGGVHESTEKVHLMCNIDIQLSSALTCPLGFFSLFLSSDTSSWSFFKRCWLASAILKSVLQPVLCCWLKSTSRSLLSPGLLPLRKKFMLGPPCLAQWWVHDIALPLSLNS